MAVKKRARIPSYSCTGTRDFEFVHISERLVVTEPQMKRNGCA